MEYCSVPRRWFLCSYHEKNALKSDFWMKNASCPAEQFLETCWCNICQSLNSVTEIFKITLQVSKSTLKEGPRPVHYH